MESTKKSPVGIVVTIIVIILLVLLGYGVFRMVRGSTSVVATQTSAPAAQESAPPTAEVPPVTDKPATPPSTSAGSTPKKLPYAEALQKYADSRIQLDDNCQAVPNKVTYKNNTPIMFDNRAGVSRKIVFNTKPYTIGAYDYIVLPLVAPTVPSVTYLDCANTQNVATISIQK